MKVQIKNHISRENRENHNKKAREKGKPEISEYRIIGFNQTGKAKALYVISEISVIRAFNRFKTDNPGITFSRYNVRREK